MNLTKVFILAGLSGLGGLAIGYFFHVLIVLQRKSSIELKIKQLLFEAKDKAQNTTEEATKKAQRILSSGGAMILFPEGTRQKNGVLGTPKSGVGMLAFKSGCPVVPVYVHNTDRLSSFKRVAVCFGKPLKPEGDSDYQAFSKKIMLAVAGMKEAYLGSRD